MFDLIAAELFRGFKSLLLFIFFLGVFAVLALAGLIWLGIYVYHHLHWV